MTYTGSRIKYVCRKNSWTIFSNHGVTTVHKKGIKNAAKIQDKKTCSVN